MGMTRQHIISKTLRTGILLSGGLMLFGFLLYAIQPVYYEASIPAATWQWFRELLQDGKFGNPFLYLYAGIFTLMVTPIVRVFITGYTFLLDGNTRYTLISLVVLLVIAVSIAFAVVH
ncbi:MAG: hypothetical protein C0600_10870 [Ignavibacteria bacterium]|nr:MAG: hypothetical protein C0600_10870 [Ignavibacteria bacterium]